MRFYLNILSLVCICCLLSACNDSQHLQKIKKKVKEIKTQKSLSIEAFQPIKPVEKITYQAHKLRSPFDPPKTDAKGMRKSQLNLSRKKGPLEIYSLNTLKMVGTIKLGEQLWALIQIPSGHIIPVTTGTYLGKNHGKIIKVTKNGIKILEKKLVDGKWVLQTKDLLFDSEL